MVKVLVVLSLRNLLWNYTNKKRPRDVSDVANLFTRHVFAELARLMAESYDTWVEPQQLKAAARIYWSHTGAQAVERAKLAITSGRGIRSFTVRYVFNLVVK